MSLQISMYVDRACVKQGTQAVNCLAIVTNTSSSAVTVSYFQVNYGNAAGTPSRNVPLAGPYANGVIPANSSIPFSWAEDFKTCSPAFPGQASLQYTIGASCGTSDGSTAASPNAVVSVYAMAPPISTASFGAPAGANTPSLPQQGQAWFEDTPQSGLIPALFTGI